MYPHRTTATAHRDFWPLANMVSDKATIFAHRHDRLLN
jgi:hypothetical protein